MKLKSTIFSLAAGALLLGGATACTNDFEEINTDPNKMLVGNLQPYGIFEALFYGMAKQQTSYTYAWNDELAQFTANTGLAAQNVHRYLIIDTNWSTFWNNYAKYGANAVHMYELADKYDDDACRAVALTTKVYLMSNLTDLFGDIPYSEAFRNSEGIMKPVFDSQKDVYASLLADLETANQLYAKKPTFERPTIDLVYNGDMALWRRFNNSLYLRLLMRVSGREQELGVSEKLRALVQNPSEYPLIRSNAESAMVHNTGVDPYYNYFRPVEKDKSSFTTSSYHITQNFLNLTLLAAGAETEEDPRLSIWAEQASESWGWKGTVAGCHPTDQKIVDEGTSRLNYAVLVQDNAPAYLLDYSEVEFCLAEAALKGLIDGGEEAARQHYEAAVTASCNKWGQLDYLPADVAENIRMDQEDIDKLLAGKLAGWDQNENKEELIGNQKYLSLFWVGFEAYNELRRTSYPRVIIGPGTAFNNYELPQRMGYPSTTMGTNGANAKVALDRQGGDNTMRTPVWWSYKAINGNFPTSELSYKPE